MIYRQLRDNRITGIREIKKVLSNSPRNIMGYEVELVLIKIFSGVLVVTWGSIRQYIQLAGRELRPGR